MGIAESIVGGLTEMVTGSASAIGNGISGLLFNTEGGISNAGNAIFEILGIGFGVGLMSVIFGLIRFR